MGREPKNSGASPGRHRSQSRDGRARPSIPSYLPGFFPANAVRGVVMVAKSVKWVLAGLMLSPTAALALGLGDIHLLSTLNAPLDADIDLVGATPDELASLTPKIASRETFAQHGLDWPAFLANVTIRPVHTRDGRDVLELRSTQPVTEPFLTLLVELDWD